MSEEVKIVSEEASTLDAGEKCLLLLSTLGGMCFGLWQRDIFAGAFAFVALLLLGMIAVDIEKLIKGRP